MRTIIIKMTMTLVAASLSMLVLSSCTKVVGEGPVKSDIRPVAGFKSISVGIPGTVNYAIGPVYRVEINAQQNILDVIEAVVYNEELLLKVKDGKRLRSHEDIVVNISAPFANRVNLSGTAECWVTGQLEAPDLELKLSGSGNIHIEKAQVTNQLAANISGSGNITVTSGVAKTENLKISGSGNLDLSGLLADKAKVDMSGSGNSKVHLSQELEVFLSGSGSVLYKGNPLISTHISGSGSVRPL